jgi:hypothetical protein
MKYSVIKATLRTGMWYGFLRNKSVAYLDGIFSSTACAYTWLKRPVPAKGVLCIPSKMLREVRGSSLCNSRQRTRRIKLFINLSHPRSFTEKQRQKTHLQWGSLAQCWINLLKTALLQVFCWNELLSTCWKGQELRGCHVLPAVYAVNL